VRQKELALFLPSETPHLSRRRVAKMQVVDTNDDFYCPKKAKK